MHPSLAKAYDCDTLMEGYLERQRGATSPIHGQPTILAITPRQHDSKPSCTVISSHATMSLPLAHLITSYPFPSLSSKIAHSFVRSKSPEPTSRLPRLSQIKQAPNLSEPVVARWQTNSEFRTCVAHRLVTGYASMQVLRRDWAWLDEMDASWEHQRPLTI
jgi:hypothetical protein